MLKNRLTKKQKRVLRQTGESDNVVRPSFKSNHLKLKKILPKTENQKKTFDSFRNGKNLLLHGVPGSGKSFISLYLSLNDMFESESCEKVYIIRSMVPSRDMGFLPGNIKDKMKVYEAPYHSIVTELFGRGDAYDLMKNKGIIEFLSTSFIRGTTFDNCYVIVDECQNMSAMELHSVITRVGENCRIIFCGDYKQDDLSSERKKEYSGILEFMTILRNMPMFDFVEFEINDIVRSGLVKEYLIVKDRMGL